MASRVSASPHISRSFGALVSMAIIWIALIGSAGFQPLSDPPGGAVSSVRPLAPRSDPDANATWSPAQDQTSSSGSEEKRIESTSYRTRPDLAWHPSLAQRVARLTAVRTSDDAHIGLVEAILSLHRLLHIYRI